MTLTKNLLKQATILTLSLAFFFFSSCKKTENNLGLGILPSSDLLNLQVVDTFQCISWTVSTDSIVGDSLNVNMLGSYNDPIFGTQQASFYTQFGLPTNALDLGNPSELSLDSIVLSFRYSGNYYGKLSPQTFLVYELDTDLERFKRYYTKDKFAVKPNYIGIKRDHAPNLEDSVKLGSTKEPAQLRIKLNDEIGQRFLGASRSSNFADDASFISFFKGIYVTVNSKNNTDDGAILSFNLNSTTSKITLYYKVTGDTVTKNQSFIIEPGCVRVSHLENNFNNTEVGAQLNDSTLGREKIYVQSLAGVNSKLMFPGLQNFLRSQKMIINKAELVFPLNREETNLTKHFNHDQLILLSLNEEGKTTLIPDILEGSTFYGGSFTATSESYTFNIVRHLQFIANGVTDDYGLKLIPQRTAESPVRTVLNGSNHPDKKIKLKLTYTKL